MSGGADSVALLRLLHEIRNEMGISLCILHFDHRLRGRESDRDARFVRDLAASHGMEYILEDHDVAEEAERNHWNLEDAARRLRYAFFDRVIAAGRATRIAVAHTADDQAETVLSHLIRGTGPTGLGGIHPVVGAHTGHIVRPLLPFRRSRLRVYLKALGQPWCEDSTNVDSSRMRARIRRRLLPLLEDDFSRSIVERLCELSRLSREDEVFWSRLVDGCYKTLVRSAENESEICVSDLLSPFPQVFDGPKKVPQPVNAGVDAASRPLTERLIRRLYQCVRGDRHGLSAKNVEQVIGLAANSTSGKRIHLPGKVIVERRFAKLVFRREHQNRSARPDRETVSCANAYQYAMALPLHSTKTAAIFVPEIGSYFSLKLIDCAESGRETTNVSQTFDADSLRAPLILRNWRPGDAYTPRGRRQPRKLKQMFLAARVPFWQRSDWPVLESAGSVVWARGMPVAESVGATEATSRQVLIMETAAVGTEPLRPES